MRGAEERLAVWLRRVLQQPGEEELVDEPCGAVAHGGGDAHEAAQIVVDNHFPGQAELLAVGVDLVLRRLLGDAALLDFSVRGDGEQVADVGQAEPLALLEVGEVAARAEALGDDGLGAVAVEQLLVRNVRQDAGQAHGRERGADGLVVHGASVGDPLHVEAGVENLLERHVHRLPARLHGLRAVGLLKRVGGYPAAQAEGGLDGRPRLRALRAVAHNHVHPCGGPGGAEGGQHPRGGLLRSPAALDGLALDFGEFSLADVGDGGDAAALGGHRALGGGLRGLLDVVLVQRLRRGRRNGRVLVFLHVLSFHVLRMHHVETRAYAHPRGLVRADGDDRDLPQDGFRDQVERRGGRLPVDLPVRLHKLALAHVRADGELPVRARLALGDDAARGLAVGDDVSLDLEDAARHLRPHHAHAGVGAVLVVGQQWHGLGNLHPRQIHHDGVPPAGQAHPAARVCGAGHFRAGPGGRLNQSEITHHPSPCPSPGRCFRSP